MSIAEWLFGERGIEEVSSSDINKAAGQELAAFEDYEWGQRFPAVVAAWRRIRDRVIPFYNLVGTTACQTAGCYRP